MNRKELHYDYPEDLVATKPQEPCRVLLMDKKPPTEIDFSEVFSVVQAGDLVVVNNSGVKPCRVFSDGLEFLFLGKKSQFEWEVLFRSGKFKVGETFDLPGGVRAELTQKGRPQLLKLSHDLDLNYFDMHGEFALPPYIQKLRESRNALEEDKNWYQLDWMKNQNSLAAPTASLHFKTKDLESLSQRGVRIEEVSLDVGLGTFLPLEDKNIQEGKLHRERFFVSQKTKRALVETKEKNRRIWAIGTTALRAIESCSLHDQDEDNETELFIMPGYEFKWVSGLFTNFHQPGSSLIALVMAFYGVEETKAAYQYAIEKRFRLFSYGDLSVWTR